MSLFRRNPQPNPTQRRPSAYVRPLDAAAPTPPPASVQPAPHPTQVRRIDWQAEADAESRPVIPAARATYVPAASEIVQMPRVSMASPDHHLTADITPPAVVESKTLGGHQDRAQAWIKYAMPLSLSTGGVMTIAAVALDRVPLLSFWALLIFGLTFICTYAVLLLRYWRHTPEGVALENVHELWGYYRREQAHRHQIERAAWDAQAAITTRREDRRQ